MDVLYLAVAMVMIALGGRVGTGEAGSGTPRWALTAAGPMSRREDQGPRDMTVGRDLIVIRISLAAFDPEGLGRAGRSMPTVLVR